MSLNRHAKSRDANEPAIVKALELVGALVIRQDEPTDLLVGYGDTWYLIEVKLPLGPKGGKKGRDLTDKQEKFFDECGGLGLPVYVARSAEEALRIVGVKFYADYSRDEVRS